MKASTIFIVFALFGLGVVALAAVANRAQAEGARISECRQLLRDRGHDRVEVYVRGGHCTLTGSVKTTPDKLAIEKMLKNLEGIQELNSNGLLVAAP